ncbi:MAG: RNA-binding protein [Treponema sp.]|nr:RNA-binding protein [Treponema sp.]
MKRIYIGNLSFETNEEKLKETFSAFGEVFSVSIIMDKFTNRSKGFGFVEMPDDDASFAAIRELNGKEVDGRKVRVSIAEDKPVRRTEKSKNR